MKIILSENQVKSVIDKLIVEANDASLNPVKEKIINNFNQFKQNFTKQIDSANRLVDMNTLIDMMQNYVLTKLPEVSNNSNLNLNDYINQYYNFMVQNFQSESSKLGWGKKKLIKTLLGDKEKAIPTMDSWKFKDVIWNLLYLGNFATNENWAQTYNEVINKNKIPYYQKVRNILIDAIYS
jgi:hypothetical protein